MTDQLKYGRIERERRWLLRELPSVEWDRSVACVDRYVTGTRLRLRQMTEADGSVVYKLARKLPPQSPGVGVMGNLYLAANEHQLLLDLPAAVVQKQMYFTGDWRVDVYGGALDGLITAEIECDDAARLAELEPSFSVVRDVTADPNFSGAALAKRAAPPLEALTNGWLSAVEFTETRQALAELPDTVEHAAAWMVTLHRHQAERHDGRPYLSHPAEVAMRVAQWGGDDAQIAAALLHDALEDQAERMAPEGDAAGVLQAYMGPEVRRLVQALTHPSGAKGCLLYTSDAADE